MTNDSLGTVIFHLSLLLFIESTDNEKPGQAESGFYCVI